MIQFCCFILQLQGQRLIVYRKKRKTWICINTNTVSMLDCTAWTSKRPWPDDPVSVKVKVSVCHNPLSQPVSMWPLIYMQVMTSFLLCRSNSLSTIFSNIIYFKMFSGRVHCIKTIYFISDSLTWTYHIVQVCSPWYTEGRHCLLVEWVDAPCICVCVCVCTCMHVWYKLAWMSTRNGFCS